MAFQPLDIVGGAFLADGTETKIVTGIDDHRDNTDARGEPARRWG